MANPPTHLPVDLEAQISHGMSKSGFQSSDDNSASSFASTLVPCTNAFNASADTLTPSLAFSIIVTTPKVNAVPSLAKILQPGGGRKPYFTRHHLHLTITLYILAILLVLAWMGGSLVLIILGCKGVAGGGLKIGFGVGMLCFGLLPTLSLMGYLDERRGARKERTREKSLSRDKEAMGREEW